MRSQLGGLGLQQQQLRQAAQQQFRDFVSDQQAQRAAIDEAIADIFLETERGPISLAGLIAGQPKDSRKVKQGDLV